MRVTAITKQATRKTILEVAQKEFARIGFDAATTRDIARGAGIGTGTLFNYFATKEAIALALVGDAWLRACDAAADAEPADSLNEGLFAHIAGLLRKLKPFRRLLSAILESSLSPAAHCSAGEEPALRTAHLEVVGKIAAHHGLDEALSGVALHLYWTLFIGVLTFWARDASPRQEDTLALLDESLAMFSRWLTEHVPSNGAGNRDESRATKPLKNLG